MKTRLLIKVKYGHLAEVTPEQLQILKDAPTYTEKYGIDSYTYTPADIRFITSVNLVTDAQINVVTPEVVDMQNIMEENNRLTRELEIMHDKLNSLVGTVSPSTSTSIAPVNYDNS